MRSLIENSLPLLAVGLLAAMGRADTLTIDASGGGDFTDLPQAVAQASDGDVLRFAPGIYTPTLLDKRLSLVASSLLPEGAVTIFDNGPGLVVDGTGGAVQEVSLAHLTVERLTLRNLDGRVRVDDCEGQEWSVEGCSDVLFTASTVQAKAAPFALVLEDSTVSFQGGELLGGTHPASGEGGTALATVGAVQVQVIGSDVVGGDVGPTAFGSPSPGAAVAVSTGLTRLTIRGSAGDHVRGGSGPAASAPTIQVWGGSIETTWSGAEVAGVSVAAIVPAEPYLELGLKATGSAERQLAVFGPQGAVCFAALAGGSRTLAPNPFAGDGIRLDLTAQLASVWLQLHGQDMPAVVAFKPPSGPGLIGFEADVQGLVAGPNGGLFVTNAAQLVLTD